MVHSAGVEALLAVIAGYFLYAEQLNARMLGGVALGGRGETITAAALKSGTLSTG